MKYRWDNKYLYWGVTAFLVIVASLLCYYGLFHMDMLQSKLSGLLSIFMPIIYGAAIAYLLNPVLKFYESDVVYPLLKKGKIKVTNRKKKIVRYSGVIVTVAAFLAIVYALISMVLPELIKSIVSIINNFPSYVESVTYWLEHMLEDNPDVNAFMMDMIDRYSVRAENYLSQDILPQLQNIVMQFSTGIWELVIFLKNILIGIIVSVYILSDKEGFRCKTKKIIYAILPEKKANSFLENLRFTDRTFGGFISGKILDSIIIGLLCYVGTLIMGMPYGLLVSVVIGVTNVIPFFGPYLGAIPSAFLILLVSPIQSLYFIIFIIVLQQFDGNILGPKILGGSTGLSSFMVIVAILIGGGLFGIFGMFVGVPVGAVIYAILGKAVDRALKKKELPVEEEDYL